MASTTVGEEFMEADMKEDTVTFRSLLADDVVAIRASLKERTGGKDTVGNLFAKSFAMVSNFKSTPLIKKGDANRVYYTGLCTQKVAPNSKYKKGGIDTGSYLMIASKDSKNEWNISYLHIASAPFRENK